jgi:hypothetical protein
MSAKKKSSRIDEWLLQKIYRAAGQPAVRLGLRNGVEVSSKAAMAVANIVIQDQNTLLRLRWVRSCKSLNLGICLSWMSRTYARTMQKH